MRRLGRPFSVVWAAMGVSNLGDGMRIVALPLAAAEASRDPTDVAAVAAATRIAWIAAPVAGTWADRGGFRRSMLTANVFRCLAALVICASLVRDQATIPILVVGATALSVGETVHDTAAQVAIPSLVREEDLESANGRLLGTETLLNQFLGLPLGGLLASIALVIPFVIDAASFAAAAVLMCFLPRESRQPASSASSFRRSLVEGIQWATGHRAVGLLTLTAGALGLLSGIFAAPLVLFVLEVLEAGRTGYGILLAAAALGALAGATMASRVVARLGSKRTLIVSIEIAGGSLVAFGLTTDPLIAGLLLAINGAAVLVWNVVTAATRQRLVPEELQGRVAATYRMAAWGATAIGGIVGGLAAQQMGLIAPPMIAGIGLTACAVFVVPIPADALVSGASSERTEP